MKSKLPRLSVVLPIAVLVLIISLTIFNIATYLNKGVHFQYAEAKGPGQNEYLHWLQFTSNHPTYLDGWINLARSAKEAGEVDLSIFALEKAVEINPNSDKVRSLESVLYP